MLNKHKRIFSRLIMGAALFLLIFLSSNSPTFAATYYVDATTGLDSDTGLTEDLAWQNLSKVSGFGFTPGDSILFKKGESWSGQLTISTSGSAGNLITYGAYGTGADPIIDRTGGNYTVMIDAKSYIRIEGIKFQNATSGQILIYNGVISTIELDSITTSGGARGVYLLQTIDNLTISNSTFTNHTNEALTFGGGGAQTNISIDNITTTDTTSGALFSGTQSNVVITDSNLSGLSTFGIEVATNAVMSGLTINGSSINNNTTGIFSRGTLSNLTINNSFFNNNTGTGIALVASSTSPVTDISVNSTEMHENGANGISLSGTSGLFSNVSISGSSISSNSIHGFYVSNSMNNVDISDTAVNDNTSEGIYFYMDTGFAASDVDIIDTIASGNGGSGFSFHGVGLSDDALLTRVTASNNDHDGINVKSGWTNVNVLGCTVETNGVDGIGGDGDGISYHNSTTGIIKNCFVSNNLKSAIAQVGDSDLYMSHNIFRHDTNGTIALVYVEGTGTYSLLNNITYSGAQTGEGLYIGAGTTVNLKNNIIYGFDNGIVMSGATVDADYNLIYNTGTANWDGLTPGTHSLTSNPMFVNSAAGDYRLKNDSPAINSGIAIGESQDYVATSVPQGVGVDMGAYEFIVPTSSTNQIQYNSDGTINIGTGGTTAENSVKLKFSMSSLNALDLLTPQLEVREVGTSFTNSPTHSGVAVSYLGSNVWGEVIITDLTPGASYHWQARVVNSAGASPWTSFGGNLENTADFTRTASTPIYYLAATIEEETSEELDEDIAVEETDDIVQDADIDTTGAEKSSDSTKQEEKGFSWFWIYILGGVGLTAAFLFLAYKRDNNQAS